MYWEKKKAESNLTKIEDDPSAAIPLGPPVVTTTEPDGETGDDDKMTFTGAWFTPVLPATVDDDEGGTI
jgi:hypothetical protein